MTANELYFEKLQYGNGWASFELKDDGSMVISESCESIYLTRAHVAMLRDWLNQFAGGSADE